ncbi:hypothetical protein HanIR_Chr12g0583651 [Helianthus annuus]|nr:hypothetical protein HanIR_Chr12g0583651 [Helianthus annuus]
MENYMNNVKEKHGYAHWILGLDEEEKLLLVNYMPDVTHVFRTLENQVVVTYIVSLDSAQESPHQSVAHQGVIVPARPYFTSTH